MVSHFKLKGKELLEKKKEKVVNIQDKQSSLLEDFIFLRIFSGFPLPLLISLWDDMVSFLIVVIIHRAVDLLSYCSKSLTESGFFLRGLSRRVYKKQQTKYLFIRERFETKYW